LEPFTSIELRKAMNVTMTSSALRMKQKKPAAYKTGCYNRWRLKMASVTESISGLMKIEGGMACAVVDSNSGMVLGKEGTAVNLDVAAAGNTEVVRAKMKTMQALGLKDKIEDILITLNTQYHIIRPIVDKPGLFIYLVLDKAKANLAMARYKVIEIESSLAL
jgi:hypothetical protein